MWNIAICDDEKAVAASLQQQVEQHLQQGKVTCFSHPMDLLKQAEAFDLMFLDIDMPEMNGIALGKHIRKCNRKCALVYVTSYQEYQSMAFGVHAFEYLIKPVKEVEIKHILEEFVQYYEQSTKAADCIFESKEGIVKLNQSEIVYVEFLNRKCHIHTTKQSFEVASSLAHVGHQLGSNFVMPHKSFYVNLAYIRLVKGYTIYLTNGEELPLSQKKSSQFRKELNVYLANCLGKRVQS